jgi:hypothetical protein
MIGITRERRRDRLNLARAPRADENLAREYVSKAPSQIRTPYRAVIERELVGHP